MGKKRNKQVASSRPRKDSTQYVWIAITVVALVISAGLITKLVVADNDTSQNIASTATNVSQPVGTDDARIQLVASRFRCACGGCGELPLDECDCDMTRGAVEEKNFIRNQLQKGLSIDQVINAVNEKYGHLKS